MSRFKTRLIIGLGHKLRQGKDEAAKAILRERGGDYKVVTIAFADALRKEVLDFVDEYVNKTRVRRLLTKIGFRDYVRQLAYKELCHIWSAQYIKNAPRDPVYKDGKQRFLLQAIGHGQRQIDPDHWVKQWLWMFNGSDADVVIVPDMRYPNEDAIIHAFGGVTVKFTRLGFIPDPEAAAHPSENALNDHEFDFYIEVEDGQLDLLHEKALALFDHLTFVQEAL